MTEYTSAKGTEEYCSTISSGNHDQGVVLSDRVLSLLDASRRERDSNEDGQEFHAGVSRVREVDHDASFFEAYRAEEVRYPR